MFGIGVTEFGIILVVALLVFGPKRLPELARMLGRGLGEFRRASNELRQSLALDDLQNDLRRGLDTSGRIHKPVPPPDRPAQAGDDLGAHDAVRGAQTTPSGPPSSPPDARAESPVPDAPSTDRHSGELPLGDDHEHHDPVDPTDPVAEATSDGGPRQTSPSGSERG